MPIDNMGQGTEYLYGVNVRDGDEATYLSQIRAEERLCSKTRYYGESSVTRLQAGYVFTMDGHPNSAYNGAEYLAIEVSHEGRHLDMAMSPPSSGRSQPTPQYRNSFVAMDATEQYRPPQKTPKPRFFGTMTAFIYAETGKKNAEVDQEGRYRVHLPFDRADGTKDSSDPNRKASTWIRMAQPYVGQEQGMYFPLADGTEVLLTFINGDPDQPIISGALPNASQPSLLNSEMNLQRTITAQASQTVSGNTHRISMNSARLALLEDPPSAANPTDLGSMYMNEDETEATLPPGVSMIPPWDHQPLTADKPAYDESYIKFMLYDEDYAATDMNKSDIYKVSTDRGAGDNYVYANARTFAYPQHERVFFIGTFHEDFHLKDDFLNNENSWTGVREQFNFPAPGADYPDDTDAATDPDATVNPDGIRGVTEDKRWGDQMFYAYGRLFAWSAGKQMGDGGAFGTFNYGNGYTENLVGETGGTVAGDSTDVSDAIKAYRNHNDKWDFTTTWEPSPVGGMGPGWKGFADVIGLKFLRGESKKEGLVAATKLDPDITLADKTFGHTYSYHMGLAVNIHEGNSRSRTYGNTEDKVNGDSESVVTGDSYATTYGRKTELTIGADTEIKLASDTEVKCAMDNTFHLGVKTDLSFSGDFGFNFGVAVEGHLVNLIVDKIKAKKEDVALQSRLSAIENVQAKIAKTTIQILSGNVTCGNKTLAIHNNSFTLNS
jgi:hypothetical protein